MMLLKRIQRRLIQCAAFGFCNLHAKNLLTGKLYTGKWKSFCVPGLNCYSCPAAAFSCPIGAMQAVSGSLRFNFSFYVTGLLLAFGIVLGRAVCGFLCPFGFLQELLHKLPSPKFHLPKFAKYIKYVMLLLFVLILPVADKNFAGVGDPAFCKYICPAGTLEGGIPLLLSHGELRAVVARLFTFKVAVLCLVLVGSVLVSRFFCKVLCPLGAIYALLNKVSLLSLRVDKSRCILCGACESVCPMDVNPVRSPRSAECIRCGVCARKCPAKAIEIKFTIEYNRTNV